MSKLQAIKPTEKPIALVYRDNITKKQLEKSVPFTTAKKIVNFMDKFNLGYEKFQSIRKETEEDNKTIEKVFHAHR